MYAGRLMWYNWHWRAQFFHFFLIFYIPKKKNENENWKKQKKKLQKLSTLTIPGQNWPKDYIGKSSKGLGPNWPKRKVYD